MIKLPRNVSHKNQEFYLTKLNIIEEKLGNLVSTILSSLLEEFPQIQATQRSRSRSLSGALLSGYGSKSLTLKSWYDQTWLSRLSVWFDWFVQPKNHTLFRLNSKNQHVQPANDALIHKWENQPVFNDSQQENTSLYQDFMSIQYRRMAGNYLWIVFTFSSVYLHPSAP